MSQKIPNGYQLLRAKGIDLFTATIGDMTEFRPYGMATVMFITYKDPQS